MMPWTVWVAVIGLMIAVMIMIAMLLDEECADMAEDPVHLDETDGKWYFWDETWADRNGPYESEEEARKKLEEYCGWLDRLHEEGGR